MGSFGVGPFENDSALDWLGDANESGIPIALDGIFGKFGRTSTRGVGAGVCASAVAAAKLLTVQYHSNEEILSFLQALGVTADSILTATTLERVYAARAAIAAMSHESCLLYREWADSGLGTEWLSELNSIDALLAEMESKMQ